MCQIAHCWLLQAVITHGSTATCLRYGWTVDQTGITFGRERAPSVGGFPQGRALDLPGVEVRLENHEDYRSVTKFSGIVSIEVFEHFTRASLSAAEKVAIHLRFFERCHDWLNRGSRLSLQHHLWSPGVGYFARD